MALMDTGEAAKAIGYAESTLRRWRWEKVGPPYKQRGRGKAIYDEAELMAWHEQFRVEPQHEED